MWFRRPRTRTVRRVSFRCPRLGVQVQADLLIAETGAVDAVLRCTGRTESPPTCDQCCRTDHDTLLAPTEALIFLPAEGPGDEID
jgi:hypothetical protein